MLRQIPTNAVISQAGRPLPASAVRVGVLRAGEREAAHSRGGALERGRARDAGAPERRCARKGALATERRRAREAAALGVVPRARGTPGAVFNRWARQSVLNDLKNKKLASESPPNDLKN